MSLPSPLGNLVWIDLEMTGLAVQKDVILEAALIITDGNLKIIHEGPHLVIHQPESVLATMDEWPRDAHTQSGLLEEVRRSKTTLPEAQMQLLDTIKKYCKPNSASLAGNSVWQDRLFLSAYMPSIIEYLYYRIIDVTTVKELVARWYPQDPRTEFEKKDTHRALADIKESIAELQHYRDCFFK